MQSRSRSTIVSDIAVFVLKRDVKLQVTNSRSTFSLRRYSWRYHRTLKTVNFFAPQGRHNRPKPIQVKFATEAYT